MSAKTKKTPDIDILSHPLLWRGKDLLTRNSLQQTYDPVLPSGHAKLDRYLYGGGWPQQGLIDLLLPQAGIGELRLMLPVLQQLTQSAYVVWINPPFIPYATALAACGVNINNILVVRTQSHEETLWSMERCCLSDGCTGVLAWPEDRKLNIKETRRVQLAARSGRTMAVFFRPSHAVERSSLAELRLALQPAESVDRLCIDIVKRKGGWPVHGIELSLTEALQAPYEVMHALHQQLALWQKQQRQTTTEIKPDLSENPDYLDFAHEAESSAQEVIANSALH